VHNGTPMTQSIQEQNKSLVLRAFDLLFNKRDYAGAEKLWSPHYIQHSVHIEPGPRGRARALLRLWANGKLDRGPIFFTCGMASLPSTGMSFRTKLRRNSRGVELLLFGDRFPT
jgi:hypothetical protein